MKVSDLIEWLGRMPGDLPVTLDSSDPSGYTPVGEVLQLERTGFDGPPAVVIRPKREINTNGLIIDYDDEEREN